ncbi:MAG: hypothetical protein WAK17_23480, partial [Candidatus Nitrosopolaris sp.]
YVSYGKRPHCISRFENTIVHFNNKGVQTDTNQKQDCTTTGGSSGISGSCTATSTDRINQSGGELKK